MIIREAESECLLITQPAHAWLSGQLAEHWGANGFIKPEPWRDLCFAIVNHDSGWLTWELDPIVNPVSGRPYDFKTIPIEDHLEIWEKSSRETELSNRFSALLVSYHVTGLSSMHDFTRESEHIQNKKRLFLKRQYTLQKRLTESLQADDFYHQFFDEFRLLQHRRLISIFDYLSLIICMGNKSEEMIEGVPHESGQMTLKILKVNKDRDHFTIMPWPFSRNEINLYCDYKLLKQKHFGQDALSKAIRKAKQATFVARLLSPAILQP